MDRHVLKGNTSRFGSPESESSTASVLETASELKNNMAILTGAVTKIKKYTEKEGTHKYAPIEPDTQMRILQILPAVKGQEDLIGVLKPAAMSDTGGRVLPSKIQPQLAAIEYCALSYWWGDDNVRKKIYILDESNSELIAKIFALAKDKKSTKIATVLSVWAPGRSFQTKYIRSNLDSALRHIREDENIVNVWCDALCMDQDNEVEKAAQIKRMHEVYVNSTTVCIWLGAWLGAAEPPDQDKSAERQRTANTFDFLELLLNLDKLDSLVDDDDQIENWWSVIDLMKKEWFTRRWVIQELALASRPYVRLGERQMKWKELADSIALFMTKWDKLKMKLESRPRSISANSERDVEKLEANALGANILVSTTSDLFRRSKDGRINQRLLSLEVLVTTMLLPFQASNPKDVIFAVLSLAKDTAASETEMALRDSWKVDTDSEESKSLSPRKVAVDPRIVPDYCRPFRDLYTGFMEYCIEISGSLDILCRHWVPEQPKPTGKQLLLNTKPDSTKPSWLLSMKGHAYGHPRGSVRARENADSLVGGSERKNQYYDASYGTTAEVIFGKVNISTDAFVETADNVEVAQPEPIVDKTTMPPNLTDSKRPPHKYNGILEVKGFVLACIKEVTVPVRRGLVPKEALELGGWPTDGGVGEEKILTETLWRTLVADRGDAGISAPIWYRIACERCLRWKDDRWRGSGDDGDLDTGGLLGLDDTPDAVKAFLTRMRRVVWRRTFFLAEGPYKNLKDYLFGLSPEKSKVKDVICILWGCSVPVVLRQVENSDEYEFIGECYVHGMMDGEAQSLGRPSRMRWFKLK